MCAMKNYRAVMFDFDYTLADGTAGIYESFRHAFAVMGLPEPGLADVRRTVGMVLGDAFLSLAPGSPPDDAARFTAIFRSRADEVLVAGTELFPGALPLLDALRQRRTGTAIVSTKFRFRIEDILAKYGRPDAVDVITGGEDVARHKPHPEGLLATLDKLGVSPRDTLFVGDTVIDAETAARAGTDFAAVLTGTTERGAFAQWPLAGAYCCLEELAAALGFADLFPGTLRNAAERGE